jgi:hypothetical protein
MTLASTCLFAQNPQIIKLNNQDSIVFIHSQRRQKDGTGRPEDSYGTGFLISSQGHVLTASHVFLNPSPDTMVDNSGAVGSRYNTAYKLEFLRSDSNLDVAILLLPDVGLRWQPVGGFDPTLSVSNDDALFTLGSPRTGDLTAAQGVLVDQLGPRGRWQTTSRKTAAQGDRRQHDPRSEPGRALTIAMLSPTDFLAYFWGLSRLHGRPKPE